MDQIENPRTGVEQGRIDSVTTIQEILSAVEYDLKELGEKKDPSVLAMGILPFIPEADIVKEWAEGNKKAVSLTCIDKEDIDLDFAKIFLNIESTKYFNFKFLSTQFERYPFTDKFDLILILRYPALSIIPEEVFRNVSRSLSENGVLLVSGGYRNGDLRGLSDLTLEKYAPVKYWSGDFYRGCSGENIAFKFRKQKDEV